MDYKKRFYTMKPDLFPGGGKYAGLFEIDFKLEPGDLMHIAQAYSVDKT